MKEPWNEDLTALIAQPVRAQVDGWKESRRWEPGAPSLTDVPLYVTGALSSRQGRFGTIWSVGGHDVVTETIRPAPPPPGPGWDELVERADTSWKARLRRQQAWYRQQELGLPAGLGGNPPRPVSSMLPEDAVSDDPTLNFLCDDDIYRAADNRLREKGGKGLVKKDRLLHNLLSSQPMCFNLFAALDDDQLLGVLRDVFGLSPTGITHVRFESAPDPEPEFRSGAAFDCSIEYTTADGAGFVGVETKYAESLSDQKPSPAFDKYRRRTEQASRFKAGAAERLNRPLTCQLWYNALLADSLRRQRDFVEGLVVMVACADDPGAGKATAALRAELQEPDTVVRHATIEAIVDSVGECGWADHFRRRYLTDPPPATHEPD